MAPCVRSAGVGASLAVIVAILAGCSSSAEHKMTTSSSVRAYYSVESLAWRADTIVIARIGPVTERFVDNGGDSANPGVPGQFQHAEVLKVLKGDAGSLTAGLTIASFDATKTSPRSARG